MAIDLEAIRRKVDQLSGVSKGRNSRNMWKPEPGEHSIRILPVDAGAEDICWMRKFYYNIGNMSILAPSQFGKPDPVQDLIKKLHASGKPEDKELAKQLYPKTRAFAPIIVRGQEDKGVQIWSFSPNLYSKLLSWILKYGEDFRDPNDGYDIDVVISKKPGKKFADTDVEVARKSTPLHKDTAKSDAWIKSIPTFESLYQEKPADEISQLVSAWLAGDPQPNKEGTEKAGNGTISGTDGLDEVEKLAKDVGAKKLEKAAPAAKKPAKPAKPAPKDEEESHESLDSAFKELLDDDE